VKESGEYNGNKVAKL